MPANHLSRQSAVKLVFAVLLIAAVGCRNAQESSIKTYSSPEEAGATLAAAAKAGDPSAIPAIFGPGSQDVILSGDSVEDKNASQAFVDRYSVMHRWRQMPDGSQILLVGADNFPFPIPLKKNESGQWLFDTAAGKDEMLSRRIGQNELEMISVCQAVADAQTEYFSQPHDGEAKGQYAAKFISDPAKQNGLYWKSSDNQPKSPLGPLAAVASSEGYKADGSGQTPFHGYYLKMLTAQGGHAPGGAKDYFVNGELVRGFAVIAYPAQYGNSGIMTFMVDGDGVVLQKDLGKGTKEIATAMTTFDPGAGWAPAQPESVNGL
jgi:Protein of unknown function (DUF2950)